MKMIPLCLLACALAGCSTWFADSRDQAQTAWMVERARTFRTEAPLPERAEAIENRLWSAFGVGDDPPWFAVRRRLDNKDPHGYTETPRKGTVADAALYGGRTLEALVAKARVTGDWCSADAMADVILRIARISYVGIEAPSGRVARGIVPVAVVEREKWDLSDDPRWFRADWPVAAGQVDPYWVQGDASPGQVWGLVQGLTAYYLEAPDEERKALARHTLRCIGWGLVRDKYRVLNVQGQPTAVSSFGMDSRPILLVGDGNGATVGLFDDGTYNPAARQLTLLAIMRCCAAVQQDPGLIEAYRRLAERYAPNTVNAGFNLAGIADSGGELVKLDAFAWLRDPRLGAILGDDAVQHYYRDGMRRIWGWFGDSGSPVAVARWLTCEEMAGKGIPGPVAASGRSGATLSREKLLERAWWLLATDPDPYRELPVINSNRADVALADLDRQAALNLIIELATAYLEGREIDPWKVAPAIAEQVVWTRPDGQPEALTTPAGVLPGYERPRNSWPWERPIELLDDGDPDDGWGEEEYSRGHWLAGYWLLKALEADGGQAAETPNQKAVRIYNERMARRSDGPYKPPMPPQEQSNF